MKRLHIHLSVKDVEQAIPFYQGLFGQEPDKSKSDYARWKLEDPKVNFAISSRSSEIGLDHLGVQYDDEAELLEAKQRLEQQQQPVGETESTTCCYAESVKAWSLDPAGIAWENFVSMGDAEIFGKHNVQDQACCNLGSIPVVSHCC